MAEITETDDGKSIVTVGPGDCMIIYDGKDESMNVLIPKMDEDDVVPPKILAMTMLMIKLNNPEFIAELIEEFKANA